LTAPTIESKTLLRDYLPSTVPPPPSSRRNRSSSFLLLLYVRASISNEWLTPHSIESRKRPCIALTKPPAHQFCDELHIFVVDTYQPSISLPCRARPKLSTVRRKGSLPSSARQPEILRGWEVVFLWCLSSCLTGSNFLPTADVNANPGWSHSSVVDRSYPPPPIANVRGQENVARWRFFPQGEG
jgi:hypothetical protein